MKWTEEDRAEFAERITDGMVAELTLEDMRQFCWDTLYEELLEDDWSDLIMHAQEYAPELLTDG
jgi:hypothetical protein